MTDQSSAPPLPPLNSGPEPYSRFEIELEFVQCLANPFYLNYLAQTQYLTDPAFLAYIEYLEYFRNPEYTKLLTYPKYSLNALSLLKEPAFRIAIISPHVAKTMFDDGVAGVSDAGVRARMMVMSSGEGPNAGMMMGSLAAGVGGEKGTSGSGPGSGVNGGAAGESEKANGNGV